MLLEMQKRMKGKERYCRYVHDSWKHIQEELFNNFLIKQFLRISEAQILT
jgi:hypothetical protein